MSLIIKEPAFNQSILKPETVIVVTAKQYDNIFDGSRSGIKKTCLVKECNQTELDIVFLDEINHADVSTIKIEDINREEYEIELYLESDNCDNKSSGF